LGISDFYELIFSLIDLVSTLPEEKFDAFLIISIQRIGRYNRSEGNGSIPPSFEMTTIDPLVNTKGIDISLVISFEKPLDLAFLRSFIHFNDLSFNLSRYQMMHGP
jgi:hypothetical protein